MYALPGVPYEMHDMMERAVLPDLRRRAGEAAVIRSRTLRDLGLQRVRPRRARRRPRRSPRRRADSACRRSPSWRAGWKGSRFASRSRPPTTRAAEKALDVEEAELRALLGDAVFGVDDETMEIVVGRLLLERGLEPRGSRIADRRPYRGPPCGGAGRERVVPGSRRRLRRLGVKRSVLGLGDGPVVTRRGGGGDGRRRKARPRRRRRARHDRCRRAAEQEGRPVGHSSSSAWPCRAVTPEATEFARAGRSRASSDSSPRSQR